MDLDITISIDDVNPKPGWQILGTPVENRLRSLNDEFGVKYTLFCPSNYHGEYRLSEHKGWVQELNSIDWIELAAHGHLHMTSDPKRFGECEFVEIDKYQSFLKRFYECYYEWESVAIIPKGWKNPGWLCSETSCKLLNGGLSTVNSAYEKNSLWKLEYVSLHYEHNHELKWDCKEFYGHDGIQQEEIGIHNIDEEGNGMIMFTSHISGDWNDNVWNEKNYQQLRLSLEHLIQEYECSFKTLKECLS